MRDILVHVIRHPDWDPATRCAARLAASLHASLTGVAVVPLPNVPIPYYDGGAILAQYATFLDEQLAAARAAEPAFSAWASSLGVAHPAWLASQGQTRDVLRHVGNWHDLLVLGIGPDDPWTEPGGIAGLVLRCGLPCLVVPEAAPDVDLRGGCVAVAWNGSVEAIRALHAALPVLQLARRIVVLQGKTRPASLLLPEFALEGWCERHGLPVEYAWLPGDRDEGEALLAGTHEAEAQLLVMGAYGHTRMSEWMLGGVTRHMLQHADLPLLTRH